MATRFASPRPRTGCLQIAIAGAAVGLLLVVNGMVVSAVFLWVAPSTGLMGDPRLALAAILAGPVLLSVAQWWIYDRIVDWVARQRLEDDE